MDCGIRKFELITGLFISQKFWSYMEANKCDSSVYYYMYVYYACTCTCVRNFVCYVHVYTLYMTMRF